MNWCNGFSTTLTLRTRAVGRHRCNAVSRSPAGRWRLRLPGDRWRPAALGAAWLAGPLAGLAFLDARGVRHSVLILAGDQRAADWRRLRVHLKLPRT